MSLFISFEGGEGSGKTTQAKLLQERMTALGNPVVLLHEPGGTELGEYLRRWLKRDKDISLKAELFLFEAARAELVAKILNPLEREPTVIILDRYTDSTLAYQGYGRGLEFGTIRLVNDMATQGALPALVILLDLPPEEGLRRVGHMRDGTRRSDPLQIGLFEKKDVRLGQENQRRFEEESLDFHRRVRKGYLELASQEPGRWFVVDGTLPKEKISELIWQRVTPLLSSR